ncbi:MAG: hypothetical protein IPK16_27925 [Anaerolineales bacterium]|nr:hypothetical protein [Anaerolineales bacterium]
MQFVKPTAKFRTVAMSLVFMAMITPSIVAPQIASAKGGNLPRHRGWVEVKPASGKVGTWTVGGKTFVATKATQLDQAEGALTVGACAKVKFKVVNGQNQAVEIDSEPAADCK